MQWRVPSNQTLTLHCWDDEFIVFNSLSGDTHLLGLLAGQILRQLQQSPSDARTLAAALAPLWQAGLDAELSMQIEPLLTDLQALALIERTTF